MRPRATSFSYHFLVGSFLRRCRVDFGRQSLAWRVCLTSSKFVASDETTGELAPDTPASETVSSVELEDELAEPRRCLRGEETAG